MSVIPRSGRPVPFTPLLAVVLLAVLPFTPATAAPSWHDIKCQRYASAWRQLLAQDGSGGLGAAFLARHEAFLASNCTLPPAVCPRSKEELAIANTMVVLSMNAGTASTFPPFACPR